MRTKNEECEAPTRRAGLAEERAWLAAAQAGDAGAYGRLVQRYQAKVYALAFRILRHRDDAWDVVQEAFVKAFRSLHRFHAQCSFYTWLYRIAYNLSIDALRARRRRALPGLSEGAALDEVAGEGLASTPPTPDEALAQQDLRAVIGRAIDALSEKHRAIIVLREVEGLSYEELSVALNISKGTVMSRLFHARKKLQALLGAQWLELGPADPRPVGAPA